MSKHTPAPWMAFIRGNTIAVGTAKTGKDVDRIVHWSGFDACGVGLAEQKANARVIAAAPEAISELARVTDLLDTWAKDHPAERTSEIDAALHCARAVLAKAKI